MSLASDAWRFWLSVLVGYAVAVTPLVRLGVPSPYLFAGVVSGAACAILSDAPRPFPARLRHVGAALIGVAAGSMLNQDVLKTLARQPVAIVGAVVSTLALSLAAGQVLRLSSHVNVHTAMLASIAGGASGITAVAREVDADEPVVMAIQYLRVVLVLVTIPAVSLWYGGADTTATATLGADAAWSDLGFTALCAGVGLALAAALAFTASRLVLPMIAATLVSLAPLFSSATVPPAVLAFGYAAVGLMVGLSFTRATLRKLAVVLPLALLQLALGLVGCAVVGMVLARAAGLDPLDGYLATTPGGLPAVTAIAIGSGVDVGLVIAVQLSRIFAASLLISVVGSLLLRRGRGEGGAARAG